MGVNPSEESKVLISFRDEFLELDLNFARSDSSIGALEEV